MPLFVKRTPPPVEARQVPKEGVERIEVANWCNGYSTVNNGVPVIFIRSLGACDRWCDIGDWIVKTDPVSFHRMSAEDFAAEYVAENPAVRQMPTGVRA